MSPRSNGTLIILLPTCSQSLAATQRLMRDFKRLQSDPPEGANGSPNPDNIMKWNAVIFGPEDTPWDGGMRPTMTASALSCVRAVIAPPQQQLC